MRGVLLDLTPLVTLSTLRGIGRYARGLVQGLAEVGDDPELPVRAFSADHDLRRLFMVDDPVEYCARPAQKPRTDADGRRSFRLWWSGARLARTHGGLLHLTDPKGLPRTPRQQLSLTCHDLIPLVMHEEYLPPIPGWDRLFAALQRVRYERAQRVIAVSHATKRDLCERLGIPEERVDVVWHGVDHAIFQPVAAPGERARLAPLGADDRPFVLYVGAGDARKDLDTLVQAFARSRLRGEARLLIVGRLAPTRQATLVKLCRALQVEEDVRLVGYVEEELVPLLYRQAAIHVFASRYEGFGLPVLEALAAGVPTITSPGSSLDEVAGDAAIIVPCGEREALSAALEEVFFSPEKQADLRARGLARAAQFTWRRCAAQTRDSWRRALSA